MKKIIFIVILLTLFSGCYCREKDNSEPPYPQIISGWKYRVDNGVGILGEFVLKKGESINNGKVEIKVIDIIREDVCAHPATDVAHRRVKLQFIRMSDKKVVCESAFPVSSCIDGELDEFRIFNVGTRGINIKEQWAHIILLTTVDE